MTRPSAAAPILAVLAIVLILADVAGCQAFVQLGVA